MTIVQLNKILKEHPTGINADELPTDENSIKYMKDLLENGRAIWVHHPDGWRYVLLKPGTKPPNGISVWKWLPPEL